MNVQLCATVQTRIIDAATGRVVKKSKKKKNLVLDNGLDALAQSTNACYPAEAAKFCQVGSSNDANRIDSGAITFDQSGTSVTSSAGFFTSAMVGAILKYGSGSSGAEYYIATYVDSQHVTVDTTATVSGSAGSVWMVNRTALVAPIYITSSYQTSTGSCGTSYSGGSVSFKRTYNFPVQASAYSVNEIGWSPTNSTSYCLGRLVLSSTDTVGTSNYYQVVLTLTFAYSPSTPTVIGNVGTNFNTEGNLMIEGFGMATVATNGAVSTTGFSAFDASADARVVFAEDDYSQNGSIYPGPYSTLHWGNTVTTSGTASWTYDGSRGKMKLTQAVSISTSGQTIYGFGISGAGGFYSQFDCKFDAPIVLPTGTFSFTSTWSLTYDRTLTNP